VSNVGGSDTIADKGWASRSEIKNFKHTANSPSAVGDEARHGKELTQPPANSMTIENARDLLRPLATRWIGEKDLEAI
jgi:hypothetical protein